jgi:glycosyltransferase involved in cell wall biosynthesis
LHQKPNFNRSAILSHGVAHFIAVSDFMRGAWVDAGIEPDRISVISNALPPDQYPRGGAVERASSRRRLGIPVDADVVLYYGDISPGKGVGTLLDAWADLGLISNSALLVLVGSPEPTDVPELDRKLRSLSPAAFRWFPMQTDVISFLHAADLVVFPSWLEEGFGRVVIEGMATGRPVIASRVGAVPTILSGPMERFLVEPRSSDALGSRILSLLEWRRSEPGLGEVCAEWVEAHYPYDEHVTALEQVLLKYRRQR